MIAIHSQGLGKQYRLGVSGTGWFVRDLQRAVQRWSGLLGGSAPSEPVDSAEHVWAIRNIDLEITEGDVVGIVGRNGAGKSTLLKVLSRITRPTEGRVVIRGSVASLLEVGTGFHPELTGRENIFLNGAILGLSQSDIRGRFDDIVDFAGIERFVDTPVKRYSSGMYVRLAFAVASQLESDILLVDEVLAVGDLEFQKRCLRRLEDVGRAGRTVLFVSHNMGSILSLCKSGILMNEGTVTRCGSVADVVDEYVAAVSNNASGFSKRLDFDSSRQVVSQIELLDVDCLPKARFEFGETMNVLLHTPGCNGERFGLEMRIKNSRQELVGYASTWINGDRSEIGGCDWIMVTVPRLKLVQDEYFLDFNFRIPQMHHVDAWWDAISFQITNCRPSGSPISLQRQDHWGSVVLEEVRMVSGNDRQRLANHRTESD